MRSLQIWLRRRFTSRTGWIRDPTQEGIEPNPGPVPVLTPVTQRAPDGTNEENVRGATARTEALRRLETIEDGRKHHPYHLLELEIEQLTGEFAVGASELIRKSTQRALLSLHPDRAKALNIGERRLHEATIRILQAAANLYEQLQQGNVAPDQEHVNTIWEWLD